MLTPDVQVGVRPSLLLFLVSAQPARLELELAHVIHQLQPRV